jgi:hypothetical protein
MPLLLHCRQKRGCEAQGQDGLNVVEDLVAEWDGVTGVEKGGRGC